MTTILIEPARNDDIFDLDFQSEVDVDLLPHGSQPTDNCATSPCATATCFTVSCNQCCAASDWKSGC
ncbi:hypothetical protein SAMN05216298_2174 [Glycomyces sambucus]|uniref:Uncharacterized protein n=1 Tax=Glycomyces sambucus TaxID=380244 RepID=A0A1G9G2U0_9ACTN|nr:hypothetical protein [Glycomyces sambucus]SDK94887.1 hypothetical protein SAMN05216298_2174 [Glycomyces sambucus]